MDGQPRSRSKPARPVLDPPERETLLPIAKSNPCSISRTIVVGEVDDPDAPQIVERAVALAADYQPGRVHDGTAFPRRSGSFNDANPHPSACHLYDQLTTVLRIHPTYSSRRHTQWQPFTTSTPCFPFSHANVILPLQVPCWNESPEHSNPARPLNVMRLHWVAFVNPRLAANGTPLRI